MRVLRVAWASLVVVLVLAVAGLPAGIASASVSRLHRGSLPAGRASENLLRAPAGLRAAVRRTLGVAKLSRRAFQEGKLTASDGAAGDDFGDSVALYGSTAVVGAPNKNASAGAAYVFVRSGTKWSQQAKLTASDAATINYFGYSVALYGSTALVGAFGNNSSSGAAYVFVRSGTAWSQQAKLTASDAAVGDAFGGSVALYRSTALVGALSKNSNRGAAYVFVRSGTDWSQQAKLTASDPARNHYFGVSVALYGSTAVVGAPHGKDSSTGEAYVFVRSGTDWSQQAKLTASDSNPARGNEFGHSVALYGSTAIVGAPGRNHFTGAAYVFVRSGTAWSHQAKLTASDAARGHEFGYSVALYRSTALASAPLQPFGAAYVFARSGTAWSQQRKLTASDGAAGAGFGDSVALYGSTAVVGAPNKNSATGAAYAFGSV